jgi:nucleoside phosphorylase
MEAYGVAFACNHHPNNPEVLILKAICDFADQNKNDIYQSAASFVSAKAFYKLFTDVIEIE